MQAITHNLLRVGAIAASLILGATAASAATLSFNCISDNSGICASAAPQMQATVSDAGGGLVSFLMENRNVSGAVSSFIGQVYLDEGATDLFVPGPILNANITSGPGVSFDNAPSPGALPGGNTVNFSSDYGLGKTGKAATGINVGEYVLFKLQLNPGKTFADVEAALVAGNDPLRLGLHVQSIGTTGQSDGMVSLPPGDNPVPEPSTYALMGLGLAGLGFLRRK